MPDLLFVYGSLLSGIAHPQGERLRREADLLGPARLQGRLFRVSWYPGVTTCDDAADIVHGELYRLRDPSSALRWLDEYEGVTAGATTVASLDDYARSIHRITAAGDGAVYDAWVYVFQQDTNGLVRVTDGRWRG